ncbi:hypothetical protein BGZ65_007531 [Modicella reniformis]|uniref:Uncharacterized protein n=1 Tax=Modicella reniformis TaxID=1440133 RepID=A0A9P6M2I6_9FUNG|nr:hypothetical protein BGZ65_007531 [Modicella reniformis]
MKIKSIVLIPLAMIAVAQVAAVPIGPDDKDIKIANGGPVGPGLSALVAIAENILRKYGITKSFADIMDLDAGILGINGKEGIIGVTGKLLGNSQPKTGKLDAANQKVLPTDIYKPVLPAQEQDGVKFHNIDVVSFLPGVVDETWIFVFGDKKTHFGTNKDISGENRGSPEEEKKPLKGEKCPPLVIVGIAGNKVMIPRPGEAVLVEEIKACWGAIPDVSLPFPDVPSFPDVKYAILELRDVLRQE